MTEEIEGIRSVEWEQFPSVQEFYDTLPTEVVIGKMPDIVMLNNEEYKSLIDAGFLEPLSDDKTGMECDENVWKQWNYEEQLYGYPGTAAPALFIINEDIWKESGLTSYPETWEQVYESAKHLKAQGYMPLCIDIGNMYHVTQYLLSFGGGWKEGVDMNTEENREALSFILKMFDEGLAVTAQDEGRSWDGEVFSAGECVMSTGGTWYTGMLKENPDISYRMLPVPCTDKGNGKTLHSYGFSVMRGCQDKQLAEKAARYMVREEAQRIRMEVTGDCPAMTSLQKEYFRLYPQLEFVREDIGLTKGFDYPVKLELLDEVQNKLKRRVYGEEPDLMPEEILSP